MQNYRVNVRGREKRGQARICRKIVHLSMRKKIEDQSNIVREK